MSSILSLERWFDVRKEEWPSLVLSFLGAFLMLGFLVTARSIREALYLIHFDVTTLPYITISVAVLGLPTIAVFTRLLAARESRVVLRGVLALEALGLVALQLMIEESAAVVVFYLWTALGVLMVTTGFWIVTSELFALRSAKRLFSVISAGGTLGAMLFGTSLGWLTTRFSLPTLILVAAGVLVLMLLLQFFLPASIEQAKQPERKPSLSDSLDGLRGNSQLRTAALIVFSASLISTLLDYQFKETVRAQIDSGAGLAGFFGSFYGITGGISLFIQVFVGARVLKSFGIVAAIGLLPLIHFIGSAAFLAAPGLLAITLLRGADNSVRRSLYRASLEYSYVPIPLALRKRTKAFIDSIVDSTAEGVGAGIIFVLITWLGISSWYLSLAVMLGALYLLHLSRNLQKEYYGTLVSRLDESGEPVVEELRPQEQIVAQELMTDAFSVMDLKQVLPPELMRERELSRTDSHAEAQPMSALEVLRSKDTARLERLLAEERSWNEEELALVVRCLVRDTIRALAVRVLRAHGECSLGALSEVLADEEADFVVRRRIPAVISGIEDPKAQEVLSGVLCTRRFEVRYRSALALQRLQREERLNRNSLLEEKVWEAVRFELAREKAVWEMQKVIDQVEEAESDSLREKLQIRGQQSLEHVFRLLSLVHHPEPVRNAFLGILQGEVAFRSFALEYLEHILPKDVKERLWVFIGDLSDYQASKSKRPLDDIVGDLLQSGATLFASKEERKAVMEAVRDGRVSRR